MRRWPIAVLGVAAAALVPGLPVAGADSPDEPLHALIMGGTGMPTPSAEWRDAVVTDYLNPLTGGDYTPVLVETPASFNSASVGGGLASLQAAIADQQLTDPGRPFAIGGLSQGAVIAVDEKIELIRAGGPLPDVTFLLLGSLNRPNGGIFARLPDLVVPGMPGFDFNGAEPTDGGIATIDIANQYDFFADFPQYPTNLLADLNGFFGIIYAHAAYAGGAVPGVPTVWPPSDPLTGPFVDDYVLGSSETVRQVVGDTAFYFVPATTLPLLGPLWSLGVPQPVLDIVQPALQVIIESGYDRSVGFGDAVPLQLFATLDPVTFTVEFARALAQGADNAFSLFGAELPGYAELQTLLGQAQAWSAQDIGVPYYQAMSALNDSFNPFTMFATLEAPFGAGVQQLLDLTGVQQGLLDPVLGLIGTLGGDFTS